MDWQMPLTLTLIASAGGYLGWRSVRSWRARRNGCGGGCGCSKAPAGTGTRNDAALISAEQLTLRPMRK